MCCDYATQNGLLAVKKQSKFIHHQSKSHRARSGKSHRLQVNLAGWLTLVLRDTWREEGLV